MTKFIRRVIFRPMSVWEHRVAVPYRRLRFILSCWLQGVELVLGRNVKFFHPVRVWGVGGRIVIEDNVRFAFYGGNRWLGPIHFQMRAPDAQLRIGQGCWIMQNVQFACFGSITLGAQTAVGGGCVFLDSDVHDFSPDGWSRPGRCRPIVIGRNVKICPETTILKGVRIGDHAVIGNKSVVQKSLPERCVAAGNPARVFLQYPAEATAK